MHPPVSERMVNAFKDSSAPQRSFEPLGPGSGQARSSKKLQPFKVFKFPSLLPELVFVVVALVVVIVVTVITTFVVIVVVTAVVIAIAVFTVVITR